MKFENYEPPTTIAPAVRRVDALTGEVLDWQSSCAELAEEKRALAVQCEALRDQVAELSIRLSETESERDEFARSREHWMQRHAAMRQVCSEVEAERDELLVKVCNLRAQRDDALADMHTAYARLEGTY